MANTNEQYTEIAELAGGFIHEIKNHLSTLGLNLQLLADDFAQPQTQQERRSQQRIARLQNEWRRLVEVSEDFLRFARVKPLEKTLCTLHGLVEELLDFFGPSALQAKIEVRQYVPADLPPLELDRDLFKQALLNLLLNAQQAMPDGGQLTLQAGLDTSTTPPTILLSLIDTGKGMTPETVSKIFRPFYTTKPGGSGLGLPTVRRIVQAHGGTIDVQSEVGRGTKFTLKLPLASPPTP